VLHDLLPQTIRGRGGEEGCEEGFRCFKLKTSDDPSKDTEAPRNLSEALDEAQMFADANRANSAVALKLSLGKVRDNDPPLSPKPRSYLRSNSAMKELLDSPTPSSLWHPLEI